jgi:hypothetical protein
MIQTRSEQRLAQLEAIQRPLNEEEGVELRKCLHAIYMRQWRAERDAFADLMNEHRIFPETIATMAVDAIAQRMEDARDESWPLPKAKDWQEHARTASDQLRDTILRAQGKLERVAA